MFIEASRGLALGMDHDCTNAEDVGSCEGASERGGEQRSPKSLALPRAIDGKTPQQHHRNGMSRQAFAQSCRSACVFNACCAQAVVAHDTLADDSGIYLSRTSALIHQGMALEISIE